MTFPTKVSLRAPNGQYVRAEGGGGQVVTTSGTSMGRFETFTVIERGNNQIALQVDNRLYLSVPHGAGSPVMATAAAISSTEIFAVIDRGGGQVALQAHTGLYLHAAARGVTSVMANATTIGASETFDMIEPGTQIEPRFGAYDYSAPISLPAPGRGAISFTVTAQSNVYVGISSLPGSSGQMYEIVFAGPGGASILRRGAQGPLLASSPAGLLSPGGSNQLWVAIDATTNTIQAGRGELGQNPIFSFSDPQFLATAQFVAFSCWDMPIVLGNLQSKPVMMALQFPGSPATAVHLGNPPKLNIQNRISIAAWVLPVASDGLRNIVARGFQLSPPGEVFLRICDGSYQFGSWDHLGAHMVSVAMPAGDLGTWVHLAGVYDGSTWILYRNGITVGQTVDSVGAVPVPGGWSIGSRGDFLERSFRGRICAVSIWNTTISAALLQACMAHSLIGFEPGLVGYWPLGEGFGTVALDKTAAPANGTVVTALWVLGERHDLPAAPQAVVPPLPPMPTLSEQDQWSRCRKCQGLFYGPTLGVCPQGGRHDGTGSFNYHILAYPRPDGQGQRGWYWCRKCSGIFLFSGVGSTGSCAAGNTHDHTESAEYVLVSREPSTVLAQPGWVWCSKCQLLTDSSGSTNICPAGGTHTSAGSAAYVVKYEAPLGTITLTAQPSTGLPPSTGDPSINSQLAALAQTGVSFSIFGVPFTMPLRFSGALKTTFTTDTADIVGSAHLDSPFSTDLGQLQLKLNRTPGSSVAYLRFDLPLSLSTILQNRVQSRVPAEAWIAIDLLAMPMVRGFDAPTVVLSPLDSIDPALPGPIVKGINFYKSIVLSSIEPFKTLNDTFPMLQLEQRTIGAHLGIGSDNGALNWQGTLSLVLNQSLGTDLIVCKSLSMTVKPGLATLEVGVKALLTVRVSDSETLHITGGVNLKKTEVGASMSLWGALDAADGAWRDPLGLKGLTINGLGIEIGASTVAPYVVLGFRGDVRLGSSALQATLAFYFNPADLGATVLQISSSEGIGLLSILAALTPALRRPAFLDIAVTDLNFYVAPKGGSIAGKAYPKGTQIGGKLNLFGYRAAVDGRIDYTSGASLHGTMDRISLRAGNVTFLELTDATGSGNPTVNVDVNAQKQGIRISGRVRIFNNFYSQLFEADVSSSGILIQLSSSAGGIFASTSLKLDRSGFALSMAPSFNFAFSLFGVALCVGITTQIAIAISESSFSQTIGFKFRAFGVDVDAGTVTLNTPICTLDELRGVFEEFADVVKNFFKNQLAAGLEVAVTWMRDNLSLAVNEAGQFLRNAGVAIADAAKALVNIIGAAVKEAALAVARTLDEAVSLLRDTFGLPMKEIEDFSNNFGNVFVSGIGSLGSLISVGSGGSELPPGGFRVVNDNYDGSRQWVFDEPGRGAITFSVRFGPAAKVGISPTTSLTGPMYEIEIGMENNTRIILRKARSGAVVASAPGGMIDKGDRLWVSIDGSRSPGLILVGRGEVGTNVLFSYSDPAFIANAQYVTLGRSSAWPISFSNTIVYWDVQSKPIETRLTFSSNPASEVQLGNPSKLDIRGPITLSAWIRPLAIDGLRNIVARGYQPSPPGEVFLRICDGSYQLGSWDGPAHMVSTPIPPADLGNWVHLTGTYDGKAWTLYHNGYFLARTVDPVGAVPVNSGWAIGSTGDRCERCFAGNIAEVTIWNKAVDMATIDTLLRCKVVKPSEGLMGYWPLGNDTDTRDMYRGVLGSSLVGSIQSVGPQTALTGSLGTSTLVPADGRLAGASWTSSPPIPKLAAPDVTNTRNLAFSRQQLAGFPWIRLAGGFEGNPSIVSWGPERLDVFSRAADSMYHIAYNRGWLSWEGLGGPIAGDPSACSRGPDLLDVFVRGAANDVRRRWWDGNNWQGFESLGGVTFRSPVGLGRAEQRDFFVLGTDQAIWWRYDDATWRTWLSLGGKVLDPPAVVYRDGRYEVFARGLDEGVYRCTIVSGVVDSWRYVSEGQNASFAGQPSVISTASGCFDLFLRGKDSLLWTWSITPEREGPWVCLSMLSGPDPGLSSSDPVAISISPERVDLLVIGADQSLWHRPRRNRVWLSWRKLGPLRILSKPAVTSSAPGRLDIVVHGADKALWHYRMDA